MNVVPSQDRKQDYKSSDKDMYNSLSIAMGKLRYRRLNCHLLLKEWYY